MNWTKEQKQAIDTRGKNILVAAAAGSGKTTLLVERIKKLIIQDHVSIDRMLVVTFTNAAASEMREKIIKTINREIEAGEENGQDTLFLRQQLDIIHRANISTFHSFGLEVIRQNFHALAIEPGFGICNDAERTIFLERALDNVLDHSFETGDENFINFANAFGTYKGERGIREMVKVGYEKLMGLPNPWQWLDEKTRMVREADKLTEDNSIFQIILDNCSANVNQAVEYCDNLQEFLMGYDLPKLLEFSMAEWTQIRNAKEALDQRKMSYDEIGQLLANITFGRMTATKEEKEDYNLIRENIKKLRDVYKKLITDLVKAYFYDSFENLCADLKATSPALDVLAFLIKDLDKRFKEEKKARNLLDFNDIEHYALEALADDKIAAGYRDKFEYIFVDEYQDSNMVQEAIIKRICRGNNRFLVGDVKQSIYRFRLAEPQIFNERYREFAQEDDTNSIKIDLNKNYRSKGNVIDTVNLFFNKLMDGYDDNAALHKGDAYTGPYDYPTELHVMRDTEDGSEEMDEAIVELERAQKEALIAAQLINENLGKPIWDSKQGRERPLEKRDIVILMRSVQNHAEEFYNVLMDQNIAAYIDSSDGYFDTIEINNVINLLSIIDNKKQDVPLIGVLHSEVFRFSIEDLIDIRIEFKRRPFYQALMDYAQDGAKDQLKEKCQRALEKISYWKVLSASMPLDKFIWELLMGSGYYIAAGALPGGVQRQANLRSLVDKAVVYQKDQSCSLFNFINYINAVKQEKVQMGQVKLVGENDDLVRIMTIHKSKGLEFPVVILATMSKGTNHVGDKVTFHKDYGIGLPLVNYQEHWKKSTILERVIRDQNRKEELEEQIRVLYVALTRAKDKLILLGSPTNFETFQTNVGSGIIGYGSYMDMVAAMANTWDAIKKVIHESSAISKRYMVKKRKLGQVLELFQNQEHIKDQGLAEEIAARINFKYPYEDALDLKNKFSVSELNANNEQDEYKYVAKKPAFAMEERKYTAAQRGTIYHAVMEHLPFSQMGQGKEKDRSLVLQTIDEMVQSEILSSEDGKQVYVNNILAFFESHIGKRAAAADKAGKLSKEKAFTYAMEMDGEKVMVQGIIDCFFEEDGKLVLLDYKTNYVDKTKDLEEEKERIRAAYQTQMAIYEKALAEGKAMEVKEAYLYLNGIGQFLSMK